MVYIVYITTNTVNDKVYVGVHSQEEPFEFDGYMGSGKAITRAVRKYGRDKFIRETLFYFLNEQKAYIKEAEIVDEDFIKQDWNYNMLVGGIKPPSNSGEDNPMFGVSLVQTPEQREEQRRRAIERNWADRLPKQQFGNKHAVGNGPNSTSFKKGQTAYNKGLPNPNSRANALKGASKIAAFRTGLKRVYHEDGSFHMERP